MEMRHLFLELKRIKVVSTTSDAQYSLEESLQVCVCVCVKTKIRSQSINTLFRSNGARENTDMFNLSSALSLAKTTNLQLFTIKHSLGLGSSP